jgi:hypothetical protein
MKKLFILAIAISSSLLFVQCKKTETLVPQEEVITTVKSLSSLEGTTWTVRSVVSASRSVNLSWTKKFPKMVFSGNAIELKMGLDLCDKQYTFDNNLLTVNPLSSCSLVNNDNVTLNDMFNGEFTCTVSVDNPDLMSIKNDDGTEITLARVNQFGSTTAEPTGIQVN